MSWRRKRICAFLSFDILKFLSADLPPIRPRLMTWSESLLIIDKLFTIRALWWFVRCLCAYSQRKLWQGSSSCVTFEIVIGLDDWRVNSPNSPHVSSSVFNALHSIFLSHLLRWGTLHGIYTKAAGKQMQMKKPHWNKGRCLVKDKAKIILPANYLLPLASMCLGCNTIPFHPWILKHHKAYINWPVFK